MTSVERTEWPLWGTTTGLRLVGYSYVPGVTVSGVLPSIKSHRTAQLTVGGNAAIHGTVRITPANIATGVLGGRRFRAHLSITGVRAALRDTASHAPAPPLAEIDPTGGGRAPPFPVLAGLRG